MSFPNKEERKKCWNSRDVYWKCLDEKNIRDPVKDGPCSKFRKEYENFCSPQWVKHFDRKRSYLQFKDRIEKDGYEPLDAKSQT